MFQPSLCVLNVFLKISICSEETTENQDFVPRVVNGWAAKLGDVPYQLAFKQMVSRSGTLYKTFCGGVIIAPSKVLSAAHCFEEKGSKCFKPLGVVSKRHLAGKIAVAGNLYNLAQMKSDSKEEGQWRELKSMRYPKMYKFPANDISVGFTKSPFFFHEYVAPIPYASRYANYIGKCLASGYGRTSNSQKITSEILLLAHLDVISTSHCNIKHRRNMRKFVCTDIKNADVGKGDSGGPLVCKNTGDPKEGPKGILVGIVSGSRLRVGTFFTRVSSYSGFIDRGRGTTCRPSVALICIYLIYGIDVIF